MHQVRCDGRTVYWKKDTGQKVGKVGQSQNVGALSVRQSNVFGAIVSYLVYLDYSYSLLTDTFVPRLV